MRAQGDTARSPSGHSGDSSSPYMNLNSTNSSFQLQHQAMGLAVDSEVPMGQGSWSNLGDGHAVSGGNSMSSSHGHAPDGYRLQPVFTGVQPSYLLPSAGSSWPDNSGLSSATSVSTNSSGAFSSDSSNRPSGNEWDEPATFSIGPGAPGYYTYGTSPPAGSGSSEFSHAMGIPLGGYHDDTAMHSPDTLMNPSAVRSLPPSLAVGHSSETLVTISASASPHRIASHRVECGGLANDLITLAVPGSNAADSLDKEARSAVPSYLNVYWDRVYDLNPIVHRSIFEGSSDGPPEHLEVLRCALAAVATQFLEDKLHRINGHHLYTYALSSAKVVSRLT